MNTLLLFATEITISLGFSAVVLVAMSRPLKNVLQDLCPTKRQADFWLSYTRIMLLLTPLLLVLVVDGLNASGDVLNNVRVTLIATLAGLLLGLMIVGKRIFLPASRQYELGKQK